MVFQNRSLENQYQINTNREKKITRIVLIHHLGYL